MVDKQKEERKHSNNGGGDGNNHGLRPLCSFSAPSLSNFNCNNTISSTNGALCVLSLSLFESSPFDKKESIRRRENDTPTPSI